MIKIIIADDHFVVRDGIKRILESDKNFAVVDEAFDGNELIEKVNKSNFDLVITDISMPNLDGFSAVKAIKKFKPDLKIILLTMHTSDIDVYNAVKIGINGMISKETIKKEMLEAINKVINEGKYFLGKSDLEIKAIVNQNNVIKTDFRSIDYPLTKRELEVMLALAEGLDSKMIAAKLGIEKRTVDSHRSNIMSKLNIKTLSQLVGTAVKILQNQK